MEGVEVQRKRGAMGGKKMDGWTEGWIDGLIEMDKWMNG